MSVRVWQSHNGHDRWADWEMHCPEHMDERITSPTWLWAMEAAWGHIAMHHRIHSADLAEPIKAPSC